MYCIFSFLSTISLAWVAVAQSSNVPGITTSAGTIQGTSCTATSARAYLSIPYAQPPIGNLRWAPPQPYNQTYGGGILNATASAPNCIQFGREYLETTPSSEDWVGPLGFLALPSAGIHGNFAIQDILLGLRWVQSNIAVFGGDLTKVVLFGQSAGAVNTFVVSTLDEAPSLIRATIMESGGGRDQPLNTSIQTSGASYALRLNCSTTDIACLRSKSTIELNATLPSITDSGVNATNFAAYVDGDIIPVEPSEAGVKVPAIFGFNSMDGTLSIVLEYGSPTTLNATTYSAFLTHTFGNFASQVAKAYPLSAFNSTPYPAYSAMVTVLTDQNFKCPAHRGLSVALQKGIPAYTYLWSHTPSCPWYADIPQQALTILGATHTSEIPFVFGNMNDSPLPNGTCNFTSAEKDISAYMVQSWRSMAENGNPGQGWPAYGNASLGIEFGNSTSADVVDYSACVLFDQINAMELAQAVTSSNGSSAGNGGNTTVVPLKSGAWASVGVESALYSMWAGLTVAVAGFV